ncbi:MAG TPA: alkaline phosphatase [Candidatus Sumerlaeota bacterium]|nr:alkaline phosphatase [Candidatus Sumerlaeota bacterium]
MRLLKTAYFSVNSSGNALRKTLKSAALLCLCLSFLLVFSCYKRPVSLAPSSPPHNVIFLIGDGMGPVHVEAARLYTGEPLSFENLPYQGRVKTYSANNSVTDSAAAGTALATGVKVNNSVIGMKIPGEQQELLNLSEWAKSQGKSTGLVTSAHMTDATPAAFGAHEPKRTNYAQIACDYLQQSRPNVLFGGGGNFSEFVDPTRAGYSVVRNRAELNAFHPTTPDFFVSGAFGDGSDGMPMNMRGRKNTRSCRIFRN